MYAVLFCLRGCQFSFLLLHQIEKLLKILNVLKWKQKIPPELLAKNINNDGTSTYLCVCEREE